MSFFERTWMHGAAIAGIAVCLGCAPPHPRSAGPESPWRTAARRDVLAAYDLYFANHPGIVDPENPGFPLQLTRARTRGLAMAERASDPGSYADALGAFSAELADGHASIAANSSDVPGDWTWPGFVAAWRGDKLYVHHAEPGSPAPAGTEISACDGVPMKDYIRARFRNQGFRPNEPGQWWIWATDVFVGNPAFTTGRPQHCTFGGVEKTLAWSKQSDDAKRLYAAATDGERVPIELREPRPGLFLIGLQNFQPNDEGVQAYHALYAAIEQRRDALRTARAIVLDLRHNGGGSSLWSRQTADALWGKAAVESRISHSSRVSWRASPGNLLFLQGIEQKVRKEGNSSVADKIHVIGEGMKSALAARTPLYVEPADEQDAAPPAAPSPTALKAPVYVITPGGCASACLDAVDVFSSFENVKRIGAPTSADTTYLEVREEDLPSGHGYAVVPMKVYAHRRRKSGEVYRPAIEVDDLAWSTATFLDRIERDLKP